MAYPQFATYQTGFTTVNATSTTITVPTGTQDKDLLLLFFSKDGTAAPSTPTDWNLLGGGSSGASYFSVFYRKITGSISDFTVTHASEQTAWVIVRIPLGDTPVINTVATGTSTAPNSSVLSSGFTAGTETLYLSACGWDSNDNLSGYPSGMSLYNYAANNTSSQGSGAAIAGVESTSTSYDPAAFSLAGSEEWAAFTVAVKLIPIINKTLTSTSNVTATKQTSVLYVGYYIERKVDNGAWESLTYDSASPYVDYDIDPGSTYCYRVRYWDGSEYSVYSNEDCETYPSGGSTPKALSSGIAIAGHVHRQTNRNISGQVFTVGPFLKEVTQNLIGFAVVTGMTVRRIARTIAGSITALISIERIRTILRAIATAVSTTATVTRTSLRYIVSWVNVSGAVIKWTDSGKRTINNTATTTRRLTSRSFIEPVTLSAITIRQALKVMSATVNTAAILIRDFTAGTFEKVLTATIKTTATAQKSISKTVIANIQTLRSVLRSSRRILARVVNLSGSLIKDIKSIKSAGIKVATSVHRTTFRAFTTVTKVLTSLIRNTTQVIISSALASGITARSLNIVKLVAATLDTFALFTKQTMKWLTGSVSNTSAVDRVKVALKTLMTQISPAGSFQRVVTRTILIVMSNSSYIRKKIDQFFTSGQTTLSMIQRHIDNVLVTSVRILTSLAYSSVIMRTINSTMRATSSILRWTIKSTLTGVGLAGRVQRQIGKLNRALITITTEFTRIVAREIRSDLESIESTFRITVLDILAALTASTLGSDIHKIVVMVYDKTLTVATIIAVGIKRSVVQILSAFIAASEFRNAARSHAQLEMRTANLSTASRSLTLSIANQEGGPLVMAYTGDTLRLYGRFYNWSGVLADVTLPLIVIYDGKGNQITTGVPSRESTGVYFFEYLIPNSYSDPLIFEMSGILEGSTILARSTIERRWV